MDQPKIESGLYLDRVRQYYNGTYLRPNKTQMFIWHITPCRACELLIIHLNSWQESHENEHKLCELLVLFSSCGILSARSRTDNWPWPRQTLPEPHDFTMTSFTSTTFTSSNDGSHLQRNRATSSLKDHIIIKSSSRVPQEVSSGISAEIHWDPSKISGSRLASSPD